MAKFTEQSPEDAEASQARMTFGEHLDELRKRIMLALYGALIPIIVSVCFYDQIVNFIVRPYRIVAHANGLPDQLATLKPQEGFLTTFTLAFQVGLIIASPWIIYQLWQFIAAGLYPRERKIVYRYTFPSTVLFLAGIAFFYFVVLPLSLNFFMTFSAHTAGAPPTPNWLERHLGIGNVPEKAPTTVPATSTGSQPAVAPIALPILAADPPAPPEGVALLYLDSRDGRVKLRDAKGIRAILDTAPGSLFNNMWRYDEYLSLVMFTSLVFGIAFELPMVIVVLAQTGIVNVQSFRNVRKYAYFTIVVIAAIAAPSGDVVNLALLSIPLLCLYELGILAAAMATGSKKTT